MIPSSADLAYFVEIAQTLNISRAAERLAISQPSLSMAMQRLEASMGVPLLNRSKRGVSLTPAGKQLLAHSRQMIEAWNGVRAGALASMQEIQGNYSIGCHPSVGLHSLSAILPDLLKQYPELHIGLKHGLSREIAEEIISLKTDIGIVVNPVRHPDLVIHPLCRDAVTLWTGPKKSELNDLKSGKAILICDPDLVQSQSLLKQFRKKGMAFSRTVVSGDLEVVADLAANGCGIGILPGLVAVRARKKLEAIAGAPVFHDEHCLLYRVENRNVRSIQAISKAIREFFTRKQ